VKSRLEGSTIVGVEGSSGEDCRCAQPPLSLVLQYRKVVARLHLSYFLIPPEVIGPKVAILVEDKGHSQGRNPQTNDRVVYFRLEGVSAAGFVFFRLDVVDVDLSLAAARDEFPVLEEREAGDRAPVLVSVHEDVEGVSGPDGGCPVGHACSKVDLARFRNGHCSYRIDALESLCLLQDNLLPKEVLLFAGKCFSQAGQIMLNEQEIRIGVSLGEEQVCYFILFKVCPPE